MDRVPMTPGGYEQTRRDLEQLRKVERPKILRELEAAREHGDLSENAEYHAAKEKLAFVDVQGRQLEDRLARAEVIDPGRMSGSRVTFGATVSYEDVDSGEARTYQIVGPFEADPKHGRISVDSPIARALIGREEGDEVKVLTPGGTRTVEITDVVFG